MLLVMSAESELEAKQWSWLKRRAVGPSGRGSIGRLFNGQVALEADCSTSERIGPDNGLASGGKYFSEFAERFVSCAYLICSNIFVPVSRPLLTWARGELRCFGKIVGRERRNEHRHRDHHHHHHQERHHHQRRRRRRCLPIHLHHLMGPTSAPGSAPAQGRRRRPSEQI